MRILKRAFSLLFTPWDLSFRANSRNYVALELAQQLVGLLPSTPKTFGVWMGLGVGAPEHWLGKKTNGRFPSFWPDLRPLNFDNEPPFKFYREGHRWLDSIFWGQTLQDQQLRARIRACHFWVFFLPCQHSIFLCALHLVSQWHVRCAIPTDSTVFPYLTH